MVMIFLQLVIGNIMRHAQAGLAVPDFSNDGMDLFPAFDQAWLHRINAWRFENNLEPVNMGQVFIHLFHRFWALMILIDILWLNKIAYERCLNRPLILKRFIG